MNSLPDNIFIVVHSKYLIFRLTLLCLSDKLTCLSVTAPGDWISFSHSRKTTCDLSDQLRFFIETKLTQVQTLSSKNFGRRRSTKAEINTTLVFQWRFVVSHHFNVNTVRVGLNLFIPE